MQFRCPPHPMAALCLQGKHTILYDDGMEATESLPETIWSLLDTEMEQRWGTEASCFLMLCMLTSISIRFVIVPVGAAALYAGAG